MAAGVKIGDEAKTVDQWFDELKDELSANNDVLAVTMERLRNIAGYGKLGRWVVDEIDKKLRTRGIGHTGLFSDNAAKVVLIYNQGTQVERIVEAVRHPSEAGADVLRSVTTQDAAAILVQVKALLEGVG